MSNEPLRLNLGGATNPIPGYQIVDRSFGQEAFPLAYADNAADEIRASHCLEHFSHTHTMAVLQDWVRVLKPGGLLKIAVPDFDWIVDVYKDQANQDAERYYILGGSAGALSSKYTHNHQDIDKWVQPIEAYLMGGQLNPDDYHYAFFTEWKLKALMEIAGLIEIERWVGDSADCSGLPVSLNLQGRKPE